MASLAAEVSLFGMGRAADCVGPGGPVSECGKVSGKDWAAPLSPETESSWQGQRLSRLSWEDRGLAAQLGHRVAFLFGGRSATSQPFPHLPQLTSLGRDGAIPQSHLDGRHSEQSNAATSTDEVDV